MRRSPRKYIFADEAGNLDFSARGSAYFILTSIALDNCDLGERMLDLRRDLMWSGAELVDAFHATTDKQPVRDAVFRLIQEFEFRIDVTIFEKRKTVEHRRSLMGFYDLAWYLHMKHVLPNVCTPDDEAMVICASITTKRDQLVLGEALASTTRRIAGPRTVRFSHWPAGTDPCLQVADYCCWAVQRKWERGDSRSYALIKDKIRSEYDAFGAGQALYS